jgi:hypothetical protein
MNFEGFLFDKDVEIHLLNTEDALSDGQRLPASGSFIDVSKFERFAFLVGAGALANALTLKVEQDTSATVTANVKDVANATVSVLATGDDKWYLIEVQTAHLDTNNDFHYVTLNVAGAGAGTDFASVFFLGVNPKTRPVTQPATKGSAVAVVG